MDESIIDTIRSMSDETLVRLRDTNAEVLSEYERSAQRMDDILRLMDDEIARRQSASDVDEKDLSEGVIAIVTNESGNRFVAVWTLAPGIDYFWHPVISGTGRNPLIDPEISFEVIGVRT